MSRKSESNSESSGAKRTIEYVAWCSMRSRCYNPKNASYKWYGARGVTVCDRWRNSYPAFLEDMGRKPSPRHSLDRKDNNAPYGPENCQWIPKSKQVLNRRGAMTIEIDGRRQSAKQWAKESGLDYGTLRKRLALGMDPKMAVILPKAARIDKANKWTPGAAMPPLTRKIDLQWQNVTLATVEMILDRLRQNGRVDIFHCGSVPSLSDLLSIPILKSA